MKNLLKKLTILLIATGLLWSFHSAKTSAISAIQSQIAEEHHDHEKEEFKFTPTKEFTISMLNLSIKNFQDDFFNTEFLRDVPTSPPNC